MNEKPKNRVTYEELDDSLSNFEIAFLSFYKAFDFLKSGKTLIPDNSSFKPKVALKAYDELCSDKQKALEYKAELVNKIFNVYQEVEEDHYEVQEDADF